MSDSDPGEVVNGLREVVAVLAARHEQRTAIRTALVGRAEYLRDLQERDEGRA